jgi:hypothetical protein
MNQGTEWGLLMKKNRSQKSCASVPLRMFLQFHLQSHPPHFRKSITIQLQLGPKNMGPHSQKAKKLRKVTKQ